jgi:hypothetical protein
MSRQGFRNCSSHIHRSFKGHYWPARPLRQTERCRRSTGRKVYKASSSPSFESLIIHFDSLSENTLSIPLHLIQSSSPLSIPLHLTRLPSPHSSPMISIITFDLDRYVRPRSYLPPRSIPDFDLSSTSDQQVCLRHHEDHQHHPDR